MKAREIYEKLNGKIDPEFIKILTAIAERNNVQDSQIKQLAEAYDRLVNMFGRVTQATGAMGNKLKPFLERMGIDNIKGQVESISNKDDESDSSL